MNTGIRSFVLACLFIVAITAVSLYGIVNLVTIFPQALPWTAETKISKVVLPTDIPLYKGSVLAESEDRGDRLIFKYIVPLGAQTTVRTYYIATMPQQGWTQLVGDTNFLEFYKGDGKRRTIIRVTYENGRPVVSIEISGNQNKD